MKKAVLLMSIMLGVLAASACMAFPGYPSVTLRYKMTIEVETPEGIKTGSAVREIKLQGQPELMSGRSVVAKLVKGEAVVVDLGERGEVFAILDAGGDSLWSFFQAFPSGCQGGDVSHCGIDYYSNLSAGRSAILARELYPNFVSFDDVNDPSSARYALELVSCSELGKNGHGRCLKKDNFREIWGNGVLLKSVQMTITQEAVSSVVIKYLPWLPEFRGRQLDGGKFQYLYAKHPVANRLSVGSFSTEIGE